MQYHGFEEIIFYTLNKVDDDFDKVFYCSSNARHNAEHNVYIDWFRPTMMNINLNIRIKKVYEKNNKR